MTNSLIWKTLDAVMENLDYFIKMSYMAFYAEEWHSHIGV